MSATADPGAPGEYYCPSCEQAYVVAGACPRDRTKLIRIGGGIDPMLGRNLDDKYTLLEKLGQGGMGAVYRAEQRGLGREVAVKVVDPQRASAPDMIKRFLREAKLASRLGHPNAVGVIDFGQTDDGLCYLVMELVTGRTLDVVFAAEGVFPPARLVRIATQLCDALECAHALQIVHRDLKPLNAMLLDQGRDFVKLGSADCGDRSIVGLGFTLTREPIPSQRTVITATLRCATVSYHGRYETGATEDVRVPGGSEQAVDGPFFGDCPGGHVVTGLAAHIVGDGGRFNSIVVTCAALDLMGTPVGDITEIPVIETGSEPTKVSADCRAEEVLYGFEATGGRELDRVALRCTQPSCKP